MFAYLWLPFNHNLIWSSVKPTLEYSYWDPFSFPLLLGLIKGALCWLSSASASWSSVQARRDVGPRVHRVGMVNKKCEHGRQRSLCKECGGSGLCEHGRKRSECKDCGGSGICDHGRQRSRCKDCGGSGLCEHGRERSRCKDCGGSGLCEHGRQRSRCKDCGGSGICEHGRQRSRCKDCGGSGLCEKDGFGENTEVCAQRSAGRPE